ncbi:MAG: SMI1/KNR4 family protein [Butyrivibrio sp.]|jgi:hypothetical protein|uniref:SMI1/KNR4 family protein n=1 Tax=Butyrivibrio sp. TaxID=28121 RepID=UPI001EC5E579|nr:SMI1/KNR4 family protein [Butyrivibrio sp.]MBE5840492.1 SMI1/KNR4 family protein [Butyrivibrio sp.]
MLISKFCKENFNVSLGELENKIGCALPSEYVRFLEKYNRGFTPKTKWTGKNKSDIRGFLGIGISDDYWNLEEEIKHEKSNDLFRNSFLPIAKNSFGDLFCINVDDGEIWFAYHDNDKRIKIADGFAKFIAKCKSESIGHIRTIEERKQGMIDAGVWHLFSEDMVEDWQKEIDRYSNMTQEEVTF